MSAQRYRKVVIVSHRMIYITQLEGFRYLILPSIYLKKLFENFNDKNMILFFYLVYKLIPFHLP